MSRGMPSMTALLGLLALAGYQNRDKLAELLKGAGSNNAQPGASKPGCRRKNSWRGYPENSLRPSINIRPTAVSPPNPEGI